MLKLEWWDNTKLCQQCWICYIKCMVTTALAEALSCSGNVWFRRVKSCWRMTYRVIFWENYIQQRWSVKCSALYTEFLIRMSMTKPQKCRYHMQGAMPSLLRIWWHHKVHHMWFPTPLKEVLHQTRRKLCQDLISSVDNNPTFMRNIITNDKAWCFMYDAQINGESTGWLITPSLFRKNWWNTTLLCYHICHILQTSAFQTFFSHIPLSQNQTCTCTTRYCKY